MPGRSPGLEPVLGHDRAVIGVHAAFAEDDAGVVAEPLRGEHPQVDVRVQLARAAVHRAAVEHHTIAGLHRPTDHAERVGIGVDVRHLPLGDGREVDLVDVGVIIRVEGAEVELVPVGRADV